VEGETVWRVPPLRREVVTACRTSIVAVIGVLLLCSVYRVSRGSRGFGH
jgi:hypothetical protein